MITDIQSEVTTRLPAEWAEQSGILLTWPHRESIWAESLSEIDAVFVNVTKAITQHEKVIISCFDRTHQLHIKKLLNDAAINIDNIRMYLCYSNDIWVRDHGPITVIHNGRPQLIDFVFNGWGNKYPAYYDDKVTRCLYEQYAFGDVSLQSIDLVLEGGAIETDGEGTLITTTRCLLNRNPRLTLDFLTMRLKQLFGVKRVLWLEYGMLAGDDTDGHIDTLVRFINPTTLCYVKCDDPNDENYTQLQYMEDQLQTWTNYLDKPYTLIPLPYPKPRFAKYDGRRLPLSYANFLIINGAVLVPIFEDPADETALKLFAEHFPNRVIIGINCNAAIEWYGAIHCFTMQLPQA